MLKGVDNLIRVLYVEFSMVQEEAYEVIAIKTYDYVASYSWKDIELTNDLRPRSFSLPREKEFHLTELHL